MSRPLPRRAPAAQPPTGGPARTERSWLAFCARCGRPPAGAGATAPHAFSRVCGHCGMGLVLRAPEDVAPAPGEAFLVADRGLAVCAVSESAESVLAISEPFAIGRLVSELLTGPEGPQSLASVVRRAVLDGGAPSRLSVAPAAGGSAGQRVRVGPCGPPRAALLVLEA